MNLNNKYISIGSILLVFVLVIYQIHAQNSHEDEMDALKHSQDAALQLSKDTIAQLQATIVTLNRQLTAEAGKNANGNANANAAANGAAVATLPAAGQPQNIQDRIRGLMGSPQIKQMLSKTMVNNQYGDFIRGLHLSASEKEALSQIFANSMSQKNDLALKLAAHEISQSEYNAAIKDIDAKLRDQLSGYLYKDEMTAFDQYEATKDSRNAARLQQTQEMQLERAAPDLNPESRKYVAQVFADEMTKQRAQSGAAANGQTAANPLNALSQPLDSALQRIKSEGNLDKTQMSAVEDYVAQQKDMLDAVSQFAPALQRRQ